MKQIEIFGLCGAGKSYFISTIKDQLTMPVSSPQQGRGYYYYREYLYFFLKAFISFRWRALLYLSLPSSSWLRKKLIFRQSNLRNYNEESILADCGVIQPIISYEVEIRKNSRKIPLHEILDLIKLPSMIRGPFSSSNSIKP